MSFYKGVLASMLALGVMGFHQNTKAAEIDQKLYLEAYEFFKTFDAEILFLNEKPAAMARDYATAYNGRRVFLRCEGSHRKNVSLVWPR